MGRLWQILKAAFSGFLDNDALSRGAAIAFYAATSLAPVLLIVVAIAGLAFGQDAARGRSAMSSASSWVRPAATSSSQSWSDRAIRALGPWLRSWV
jgi:uncharacterized BrkB/YihY/UPF0761 family membrane protein